MGVSGATATTMCGTQISSTQTSMDEIEEFKQAMLGGGFYFRLSADVGENRGTSSSKPHYLRRRLLFFLLPSL